MDDSETPTQEGWVDGCRDGVVRGWAWRPGSPKQRLAIELVVGGAVAGEGVAELQRDDVTRAGRGDGACGFAVAFDAGFRAACPPGEFEALVRVRGGDVLPGGMLVLDADAIRQPTPESEPSGEMPALLPLALDCGGVIGFIDQFGPYRIDGWAQLPDHPSAPVALEMWEGGDCVGQVVADIWRKDLEETRQGDGRWGISAPFPQALRDGRTHCLELRLADGPPVLGDAVRLRFAPPDPAVNEAALAWRPAEIDEERPTLSHRPPRTDAPADTMFSIVVNFYNMQREAARTLTSLTRGYQRGIGDLRYEVLCIDNGSDPPLEAAWIEAFGPEFRLVRPSRPLASPCAAINEAAAQATGRYVAIMIDGAHMLSPGVLREVWDAAFDAPEAVIALRQWFVGGDQRWLASVGYSRDQEDMLFDKIAWPQDGYKLFRIGTPVWESPNHWFDGMIESNCLFVPAPLYRRIGGMDEDFAEAGAGYANLDLFRRAAEASIEPVVTIMGQASFHQFHDGTTTNVSYETKEDRVRYYENRYIQIKGRGYEGVEPVDLRIRGQLHTLTALVSRQRPLSPARIGVTERVRPGILPQHFDQHAEEYAQSAYVECGLHEHTTWLGQKLRMAPSDAMTIQDIVFQLRPGRIVTVNVEPGVVGLMDSLLLVMGEPASRIVAVSETPAPAGRPGSVRPIVGDTASREVLAQVERALDTEERVLVLFAPRAGDALPVDMMLAYARFVSCRSYLIVLGTVFGQPWLGYSKHWYQKTIRMLTERIPFVIDRSRNPHLITTSPMGYLQRIR